MGGRKAKNIRLTERVKKLLEWVVRRSTSEQRLVQRAQIVLEANNGTKSDEISRHLGVRAETVGKWRTRWANTWDRVLGKELAGVSDAELVAECSEALSDSKRSGAPATFTAEQIVRIVAVACESPEPSGRPITHWTARELADEAVKRGIVASISSRQVARFLNEADLKPHLSRYWLNANPKDPEAYNKQVAKVCETYQKVQELHAQGVHVMSTDEKTGIQALERSHPSKPMAPGKPERIEFEYIRHGTQTLIANFEVATGQVLFSTIGQTRSEQDFAKHIEQTIDTASNAPWIFVVDNLNTHQSELLVRLVANRCGITDELGTKGKEGILGSMPSRAEFLSDSSHRIYFVYTPKHSSWLNQVEIWFGTLARRVLKRGNFLSIEQLRERILAFIEYFNRTMARPFRWTYAARPLRA